MVSIVGSYFVSEGTNDLINAKNRIGGTTQSDFPRFVNELQEIIQSARLPVRIPHNKDIIYTFVS